MKDFKFSYVVYGFLGLFLYIYSNELKWIVYYVNYIMMPKPFIPFIIPHRLTLFRLKPIFDWLALGYVRSFFKFVRRILPVPLERLKKETVCKTFFMMVSRGFTAKTKFELWKIHFENHYRIGLRLE